MKYINKIKSTILMIYNNIKYILTNDLKLSIEYIENDYDNAINDFNCRLENNENDIENKVDEYQVSDIIYNEFGSCEDYINYDNENLNTELLFGGLSVADRVTSINNKIDSILYN